MTQACCKAMQDKLGLMTCWIAMILQTHQASKGVKKKEKKKKQKHNFFFFLLKDAQKHLFFTNWHLTKGKEKDGIDHNNKQSYKNKLKRLW